MSEVESLLSARREILFLYDIRMGNPNGDPDENRPRRLPDGRFYVTDVRLKRFVRDYLASQRKEILVGDIEGKTTNLTGRVAHYLKENDIAEAEGRDLVNIILNAFIDARLFGSSLAFAEQENGGRKFVAEPKTITGPVQFNMGEVIHEAEELIIQGTSVFASRQDKKQGTFTDYAALRYGLIAFNGVANEHSAKKSCMTETDYETLLEALWNGIRSAGNTRSKVGQVPRLLVSVEYQEKQEFQFGNLIDYVKVTAKNARPERQWASPDDYSLDLSKLITRLSEQKSRIARVRYAMSPDMQLSEKQEVPADWIQLSLQ
jgi:CRISPR-associated protein Csh2